VVAYNFQKRFAEPILAGTKGGTIRAERKISRHGLRQEVGGHARPGEELQLYTGMRTKHCRLIARKTCLAVQAIKLDFLRDQIWIGEEVYLTEEMLEAVARFDGFFSFPVMAQFWRDTHGDPAFQGWHIRWLPLPWLAA
jgi:hypothetical protein